MADISAPNAALFDSDPLEQIYAKGTLSPNLAGLSALMLHAMQKRTDMGREDYLGALGKTQGLESILAQRKMATDLQKSRMDNSRHLAERGYLPSSLTGVSDLFTDSGSGDAFAKLMQEEIRSKIFANMNKGAGGGAGTKDQVKESRTAYVRDADGNIQAVTIDSRSTDPMKAVQNAEAAFKGRTVRMPGRGNTMEEELMRRHRENQRNQGIRD